MITAGVNSSRIMRRKANWEGPRKSIFYVPWSPAIHFFRPNVDELQLLGTMIIVLQRTFTTGGTTNSPYIDNIWIIRFNCNKSAFTSSRKSTFIKSYGSILRCTGDTYASVVLLCSINTVRKFCLLYTSPSPRDGLLSRMPSSA